MRNVYLFLFLFFSYTWTSSQIILNEGSNKNYSALADEDNEYPDWVELYNAGTTAVNLGGYALSDDADDPAMWVLPDVVLGAGEFAVFFCSGKDRYATSPMTNVASISGYSPIVGWNIHPFSTPFNWDGSSNLLINICAYSSAGYITNSVHRQTATSFASTQYAFEDGSDAACFDVSGSQAFQRPNLRINGVVIGTGTIVNSPFDYPAPYGNWYWGARHQLLVRASELTAAGLGPGSLFAFGLEVESTDVVVYTLLDIHVGHALDAELNGTFYPEGGFSNHTNFKIDSEGEQVYLFSPGGVLLSSLDVDPEDVAASLPDVSVGLFPDAAATIRTFLPPTPGASNNGSFPFSNQALAPVISVEGGFFTAPFSASLTDPNDPPATVRYTLDGSEPDESSALWNGTPIFIYQTSALRARAFSPGILPSPVTSTTYFLNVDHLTPVLSVITDNDNLYGSGGIFDNPAEDWLRASHVEYYDSTKALVFSQRAGIRMDGGFGGSRWQPQRSFRVKMNDGVLGDGPILHRVIPDRATRTLYSDFYLRNGSNQYQVLPYKDAAQVKMMGKNTNNYYSAWRPISVYINGGYFGLYELREKFNTEMFQLADGADPNSVELLSVSAFYGFVLRAVEGSIQSFYDSYNAFLALNPADTAYWSAADAYFDLDYYCDYIIAESWMGNVDWPWNNIKLYRSDATGGAWRFCVIDLELALAPNSWTDCYMDHIDFLQNQDPNNPYVNVWLRSMQNDRFRNYFINRFADQMNSVYRPERLVAMENAIFEQTVGEMPNQFQRWGDPFNVPAQVTAFYENHLTFQGELICRGPQVRDDIQNNLGLPRQVNVTLDTEPAEAGTIRISTLEPETYPWSGVYFDGVPVGIEAVAAPGFRFSHWKPNPLLNDTLQPGFLDTLQADALMFKAVFEALPSALEDNEPGLGARLYPSPATLVAQLIVPEAAAKEQWRWSMLDMQGRILQRGAFPTGQTSVSLDLAQLAEGLYLVRIDHPSGQSQTFRLVKQ